MEKFGCNGKFTAIVRQLHDSIMVKVLDDGDESEAIPVTSGVKEGCVLAPTLVSMVLLAMLTDVFCDRQGGIPTRYRTDGGLFNQEPTGCYKGEDTVIKDFLFADDCALNTSTEQHETHCFSQACDNITYHHHQKD
nr:uncharacterized protein LOC123770067 [Procambarus clarkii]